MVRTVVDAVHRLRALHVGYAAILDVELHGTAAANFVGQVDAGREVIGIGQGCSSGVHADVTDFRVRGTAVGHDLLGLRDGGDDHVPIDVVHVEDFCGFYIDGSWLE